MHKKFLAALPRQKNVPNRFVAGPMAQEGARNCCVLTREGKTRQLLGGTNELQDFNEWQRPL